TYQRRYELACTRCEHGWVLDTDTMDQQLGGVPIPWRHRFGLPLMLVGVAALACAGWMWRHGIHRLRTWPVKVCPAITYWN
ncbi:hypothetical protein, partial [Corynebacterium glucuronolyticum]|uniref:hypothetical protein n=1 Tax=Corynebacterium glucuronolyticum TaxID=39791 RepID=UPI00019C1CE8